MHKRTQTHRRPTGTALFWDGGERCTNASVCLSVYMCVCVWVKDLVSQSKQRTAYTHTHTLFNMFD